MRFSGGGESSTCTLEGPAEADGGAGFRENGDGSAEGVAATSPGLWIEGAGDAFCNDLAAYCTREGIPHVLFEDFGKALGVVKQVVDGKLSVKDALSLGTAEM